MRIRACLSCVVCDECGGDAYCLDDHPATYPCAHNLPLCSDCNLLECVDCKLEAEADMHTTGEYDPRKDPFYDHTVPPPVDRIERDGGYTWGGVWVPVPKKGNAHG